jgi:GTP cyclohydrolase I
VDWVMARAIIQEEASELIYKIVKEHVQPLGMCINIDCKHMCMNWRGAMSEKGRFINLTRKGILKTDDILYSKFTAMASTLHEDI